MKLTCTINVSKLNETKRFLSIFFKLIVISKMGYHDLSEKESQDSFETS